MLKSAAARSTRGKDGKSIGAAIVMLALVHGTASAQGEGAPSAPARLHVGPFHISPTLTLQDIGVDSNVYHQVTVDRPVSDFTFTAIPTFVATAGSRRTLMTLRSSTGFMYFVHQSSERSVNEDLAATISVRLRRVTPFAEAGYLNTRERPNQEIDARSRRITGSGEVGTGIALSPKLSVRLSGRYGRTVFDADSIFDNTYLALELNRASLGAAGSVRYAVTPLTSFVVAVEMDRTRFTKSPLRDADSRRILLGVDLSPRALINGNVRIGFQRFRPLHPAVPGSNGLVGSGQLNYRLSGSTTLGGLFERGVGFSYFDQGPYYVHQGYGALIRRQIVQRWDAELNVGQSWHNYALATGLPLVDTVMAERFLNTGVAVGYQAHPGTRISVAVSYQNRLSDRDDRTYNNVRLGATVVYGF